MVNSEPIDHDRLFKELLVNFFREFLELFFPEVAAYVEPGYIEFLDKEVFTDVTEGDRYQADVVAKVRFRGEETFFLIHVENQAQYRANFSKRMFRYFARLYEKYGLSVYPIALFSFNAPLTPQPNSHQVAFPNKRVLQFDYETIQLNRLNWRDFVRQPNPVASALMAKMNIAPEERPLVKLQCLRLLATLRLNPAKMQLISGFIDTYLRLNAQEERVLQTEMGTIEPAEQEVVMQIVTSWMLQGIEQGVQQGIEQGVQQGESRIVLRQLNRRLGTLAPALQERIQQLSPPQLEDLGDALLDFSSEADLVAWLQQVSPELERGE